MFIFPRSFLQYSFDINITAATKYKEQRATSNT